MSSQNKLVELFPTPSPPPSALSPTRVLGVTAKAGQTLTRLLQDNHEKRHIYFNEKGYHIVHTAHHSLAIYALGAPVPLLEAAYASHAAYQRVMFGIDEPITVDSFKEHLGDPQYYRSYLAFFTSLVRTRDAGSILEKFIFSEDYNFGGTRDERRQPQMLNRFLAGLTHPFIHVGYGLEFGLHGLLAEGLAQTAIHRPSAGAVLSRSLFDFVTEDAGANDDIAKRFSTLMLSSASFALHPPPSTASGPHIFDILARILADSRLEPGAIGLRDTDEHYIQVIATCSDIICSYAEQWTFDADNTEVVQSKAEELIWANVLLYGVAGWRQGKPFVAEFFTMHLATSVIFLPSILPYLSPPSQRTFLRSYFSVSLAWWISRGRPGFAIDAFYEGTTATPVPPGPLLPLGEGALVGLSSDGEATADRTNFALGMAPNPWFALLQSTLLHPNEHLPKLMRTLAHGASLFGSRPRSYFSHTGLRGAGRLDGALFVRVAGLTMGRLGWVKEGKRADNGWDRMGFFD